MQVQQLIQADPYQAVQQDEARSRAEEQKQ